MVERKEKAYIPRDMGETRQVRAPDLELFHDIFDASPIGIAVEDLTGQLLFVNFSLCSLLGFSEVELRNRRFDRLSPLEDTEREWVFLEQLRAGSIDRYQLEKQYFRGDGSLVWGRLSVSLLRRHATALVMAMVEDISEQKAAEEALQEANRALEKQATALQAREDLLSSFVKNVPVGVAMFDRDMRCIQVSDRWCTDYAMDSSQILGRSHYEVYPDIPERWKVMHRRGLEGETLRADEDKWEREGETRWVHWEIRPWRNVDGSLGGILIFGEDITRRKQTEQALSRVNQKLIQAQEQERSRIARELHDDISQRIAMLAVHLDMLHHVVPSTESKVMEGITEARRQVELLGTDIGELSYRLHSPKLEHLGLEAAMSSFCSELSDQQKVEIGFHAEKVSRDLPEDTSLCLFRVMQEALQNAVKHSGSRHFEVSVVGGAREIELSVHDSGKGFEPEEAIKGHGLGLTSMRERLKLINGELSIESALRHGTTVRARVPRSQNLSASRTKT